jgi:hypothetical protein
LASLWAATISELATHSLGDLVSNHPAYDLMLDRNAPSEVRGNPEKRRHWAADQVRKIARISRRLGLTEHVTFSGSLAWPYFYPYPQRPTGLTTTGSRDCGESVFTRNLPS